MSVRSWGHGRRAGRVWRVNVCVALSALAGASWSRGVVLVVLVPPGPRWVGFVRSPQAGAPLAAVAAAKAAAAVAAVAGRVAGRVAGMYMCAQKQHALVCVHVVFTRSARQKVSWSAPRPNLTEHEHFFAMGVVSPFGVARPAAAAMGVARTRASCAVSRARAAARFGMCSRMLVECVLSISIKVKTRFLQHHDFSAGPWPSWQRLGLWGVLACDGVRKWRAPVRVVRASRRGVIAVASAVSSVEAQSMRVCMLT